MEVAKDGSGAGLRSVGLCLLLMAFGVTVGSGCAPRNVRAATACRRVVNYDRFGLPVDGVSLALDVELGAACPLAGERTARFFTYLWNRRSKPVTISLYPGCYYTTLTDASSNPVIQAPRDLVDADKLMDPIRTDWVTLPAGAMVRIATSVWDARRHHGLLRGHYTAVVEVNTDQFVPHEQDLAASEKLPNGAPRWDLWQPAKYDPDRRILVGEATDGVCAVHGAVGHLLTSEEKI